MPAARSEDPSPAGLYAILDVGPRLPEERAQEVLEAMLSGGARWIQLRAKEGLSDGALLSLARRLTARTRASGARFIVNDRPDVAVLAGADGVHLGQEDVPAGAVRGWLPAGMLIGLSCHSLADVAAARSEGAADYLGFGPVFPTKSKANPHPTVGVNGLREAVRRAEPLPVVAIGGIDHPRIAEVLAAGPSALAMISALVVGDVARNVAAAIERIATHQHGVTP
jgi:thiamine-phosphate pyrophosphorylase